MADLYFCQQCGDTFIVEPGEPMECPKCLKKLVPFCEWCGKSEKECSCGKDKIMVE
ncbi:MAG: hypothetical protein NT120_02060 [Candidatus Aenigmarchaeota archaeon]|nr:hypothetical protein [Candidatus Aenigmarchaeota archaeon]